MTQNTETGIRRAVLAYLRAECGLRGARGLAAVRVTGTAGLGGIWQGYVPMRGGGQNSIGPNVHATSDGAVCRR